jgi:hypothetical protein
MPQLMKTSIRRVNTLSRLQVHFAQQGFPARVGVQRLEKWTRKGSYRIREIRG